MDIIAFDLSDSGHPGINNSVNRESEREKDFPEFNEKRVDDTHSSFFLFLSFFILPGVGKTPGNDYNQHPHTLATGRFRWHRPAAAPITKSSHAHS